MLSLIGLYGHQQLMQQRLVGLLAIGKYPAIAVGVPLLQALSDESVVLLKQLLGLFILAGGVVMLLQSGTRTRPAHRRTSVLMGLLGGIFGGLFSVVTPPLDHQLYREPISTEAVLVNRCSPEASGRRSATVISAGFRWSC